MKKKLLPLLLSLALFFNVGCSNTNKETVTDREGNEVSIPTNIERIVSTVASNTEILCSLGMGDKIVCTDTYSDGIEGLNEDAVKMDFYSGFDAETIIGLEPDIIIASGHNKIGATEDPFKLLSESGIPVVYIPSSESIEGIYEDIKFVASVVGEDDKGEEIVTKMKNEIAKISEIGNKIKNKKSVYVEMGPAPTLYSVGKSTFMNEMVEIIGAENIFKDENSWISPSEEVVINKNPDVILTTVDYVTDPTKEIKSRSGWQNINAIKNNDVYYIDANASSRPNQNIIKALKQMAKDVYPDLY